jgi:hypothetical protein
MVEMNLDRLRKILDAYGARRARWPEDERVAAEALLAHSSEARAARDEAARLDAALDEAVAPPPAHAGLALRLRAIGPSAVRPPANGARASASSVGTRALAQAAVIAFALLGGVAIGFNISDEVAPPRGQGPVIAAVDDAIDTQLAATDDELFEDDEDNLTLASLDNGDDDATASLLDDVPLY